MVTSSKHDSTDVIARLYLYMGTEKFEVNKHKQYNQAFW